MTGGKILSDQSSEVALAALIVGEAKQANHALAGFLPGQGLRQCRPGGGIFGSGEETVAINRSGERLRLAAQRMDDMTIVDAMDTHAVITAAPAGMVHDRRGADEGRDVIIVDMDPQALTDEQRWCRIEDAVDQKAASAGDAGDDLGEVGGTPRRQGAQCGHLDLQDRMPAPVSATDEFIDKAAPGCEVREVARAAQDQGLVEGDFEMIVVRLDGTVLMRFPWVVATGQHAVVAAEGGVALGDITGSFGIEVAIGG